MKQITRRSLALLLTLAMLCGLLCTTTFAAGGTWSGKGTENDPYLIEDAEDLWALSNNLSAATSYSGTYFKLTSDVEVSAWEPIGYSSSVGFKGTFDGDGHTITIKEVSATKQTNNTYKYYGLFGYLLGTVHDLTVCGTISTSENYAYIGGIAGQFGNGVYTNIYLVNCVGAVDISNTGNYCYTGGIAGKTDSNYINLYNCYGNGSLTADGTNSKLGGLVGYANSGKFNYCYTTAVSAFGADWGSKTECYDATTWSSVADADAWVSTANVSVSAYTSVTDFWSLGSDGPEHATCQHTPDGSGEVTAPTCTEKGYTTYICATCDNSYKDDYVDALGHDLQTVTTPATCTEDGSKVESCARTGCDYTHTTVLPATGHTAKVGSETEYATYYAYVCADCNETYTVYKDARLQAMTIRGVDVSFSTDGDYEWEYDEANTRLRSTNYNVKSSASQTTITMTSDKDFTVSFAYAVSSESNYDKLTIKLDSTTVANAISGSRNDAYTSGTLTAGTHTLVVKYEKDGSGDTGDDRGYLSNLVVEAFCAHENKTNEQRTEPTCTTEGSYSYDCSDCGKHFDTVIPALGHNWDWDNATVDGVYLTAHCTRCDATKTKNTSIDTWDGSVSTSLEGAGTQATPYVISSGADLAYVAQQVNAGTDYAGKYFQLDVDLDLSGYTWTPIGSTSHYFKGVFDGDGHDIKLGIDTTSSYQALFGAVYDATLKNFTVSGTVTSTAGYDAAVAAYAIGTTFEDLGSTATVSGTWDIGGIAAYVYYGSTTPTTFTRCWNTGAVTGSSFEVGGIVGLNFAGKNYVTALTDCYNTGTIAGSTYVGGLVGKNDGSSSITLTNCYSTGAVTNGSYKGALVGYVSTSTYTTLTNCYYPSSLGCNATGYTSVSAGSTAMLDTAFTSGEVCYLLNNSRTSTVWYQTLGEGGDASPVLSSDSKEVVYEDGVYHNPAAPAPAHTHTWGNAICNGNGTHTVTCLDVNCPDAASDAAYIETHTCNTDGANGVCSVCGYTNAAGSQWNPIQISTAEQLQALANEVNGDGTGAGDSKAGVYYELTADITLPGSFTPIGTFTVVKAEEYNDNGVLEHQHYENAFAGHFDGNGHTVTLNITDRTGSNARVGLFGSVVGTADDPAVIENVIVTGSVQTYGGSCVAALVGYAKNAQILNCGNGAIVTNTAGEGYYSSNGAAGILGRSDGNVTITGCFNVGAITADGYVAGIVYDVNGSTTITNCYDKGTLTANSTTGFTGGIAAVLDVNYDITLTNCYADGTYNATNPGALVGTSTVKMVLDNCYYRGGLSWRGTEYVNITSAPTAFDTTEADAYTTLLTGLGSGFQANGGNYPLLSWQTAALTPSASAHSHDYTDAVTDPTCTAQGYTTHTCTCGYSYADAYVDALGHDLSGAATNNGDGTHSHTCLRDGCGVVVTEDCSFDGGVVTTPADKTNNGVRTYTCAVCGHAKTETIPATGFDTNSDGAFVIDSDSALALLAEKVNGGVDYTGVQFVLTADVNCTTPIGNNTHPFTGSFDGGYHTVTATYSDATHDFNGLFGAISGATVEKVLVDGTVTGGSFTAAVAGYASNSVIQYCGSTAAVTGGNNHTYGQNEGPNDCYTGGIVGYAANSTRIVACYNRGDVKNAATGNTSDPGYSQYTGGIVGDLYDGSVQYSYNTGAITSTGTIYTYTGGIAGMSDSSSLISCYSTGAIAPVSNTYSGGVLGSGNLYYQQGVTSFYLAGSANKAAGTGADDKEYVTSVTADDLKDSTSSARQSLGSNYVDADNESVNGGYPVLAWETGDHTAEIGYLTAISTAAQLREFANNVRAGHDYAGETVMLLADIDLESTLTVDGYNVTSDHIWTAIGDVNGTVFAGTFDGQGYTISNMVIVNSQSGYLGLFSALPEGAVVKNVAVTGGICCDQSSVGSIVGWNLGTVENCVSNVNINVSNCEYVGGIVADNGGVVRNCVNNGTVNGGSYSSYVGGIAGHMEPAYQPLNTSKAASEPVLTGCVNTGNVTGYEYVGGIVGGAFNDSDDYYIPDIANCYNAGAVTGTYRDSYGADAYTGVIAGKTVTGIVNCYYKLDATQIPGMGDISGENYARPVSGDVAQTADFLNALGDFQYDESTGFTVSTGK